MLQNINYSNINSDWLALWLRTVVWKPEVYGCKTWIDENNSKSFKARQKKDRYVPLSEHLIRGLKKYIEAEKPQDYLLTDNHCLLEQVVILTIAIHNAACNGRLSKWQKQQE
jgi:integrase